jgi:hypothetical protein
MGFYRSDELMEPLVALPDRCDARLAVARMGSEAPKQGQAPPHLAQRRRCLRRGVVMRQGRTGVPRPWFTHHVASSAQAWTGILDSLSLVASLRGPIAPRTSRRERFFC